MSLHTIEKQFLFSDILSRDALRLARAIHNTYIEDKKNLYMEIRLETITSLLNIGTTQKDIHYLVTLFEEINEPISVKNFKFYANVYETRFMSFCNYTINEKYIEIELNEEFLLAEKEYMIDKF